ncbi:RluA family pseudouridine synthase [Staphylococcus saprophyticus]|jgi:23S rRNA pseudouridine1911/1915/1917 synthase|uniref:Pseudouridine synthase n=1 Tax=Staphylococcus saprophyticus subsp. saprophyticus (strain ATCC 15305 / DSM 20229 / NCIMB 8711 / NCTC 7292 / S-41) TaxID=342451 RepID=Q49YP7_STAS1|nr:MULTISPECIES: RluA family pseudouridine synthase [Staphylococcus]CRV30340.1 ribosomal large subunit pseudouridine synthase D [Streptococcus equi subsp. equi]AMG20004.1 RluA family pseudouridine synthase [Staphylococcus saprophyticus]AMG33129.1 RluA family pseudouridine synthase [Staphylococcus saprophyticus]ASF17826.1 RluA family pseudouridine synthase [Staphylococcus saprophyticus]MBC2920514.1 RluA family pseudouridine synthase [Staphylococcus saprophyticus]
MKFEIPNKYNQLTLREIFQQLHLPKKDLHTLNMSKAITINESPGTLTTKVNTGDNVYIPTPDEVSNYLPSYRFAQIYYEDDDIAIVMKPKGVKTHPNDLKESNTLMNHVIYTIKSDYVEPIHRLDQETVGLLIVAKNPLMKKILDRMLEENKIDRIYKANVHSLLPIKPQTIDMPIGKDKFHSNKRRVSSTGQSAITHILNSKMIKEDVCELEIKLDTGRTHQIRVHLAEIGHPVIGDPLYGNSTLRKLELNSHKIEFIHPLTQESITVSLDDEV